MNIIYKIKIIKILNKTIKILNKLIKIRNNNKLNN